MSVHCPTEIPTLVAQAFNTGSPDTLMSLYESNAVLAVPPGGERVSGLDAIRAAVEPIFERVASAKIDLVGTFESDGLAMTHADWTLIGTDDEGAEVEMTGRGTVVSRRQPDGTWLVVFDNPASA